MLPEVSTDCEASNERAVSRRGDHDEPVNVAGIIEWIFNTSSRHQATHRVADEDHTPVRILAGEIPQFVGE